MSAPNPIDQISQDIADQDAKLELLSSEAFTRGQRRQQLVHLLFLALDPAPDNPGPDAKVRVQARARLISLAMGAITRGTHTEGQLHLAADDWTTRLLAFVQAMIADYSAERLLADLTTWPLSDNGARLAVATLESALQGDRQSVAQSLRVMLTKSVLHLSLSDVLKHWSDVFLYPPMQIPTADSETMPPEVESGEKSAGAARQERKDESTSVGPKYRPEVYELLGQIDTDKLGTEEPPNRDLWLSFCEEDGLIEYVPYLNGVELNITKKGQLALLLRNESEPESDGQEAGESGTVPANAKSTLPKNALARAIGLLAMHPHWTATKIAKEAGCSGAYLSKQPKWQAARQAIKAVGQEDQRRAGQHLGYDMDQYQGGTEDPPSINPASGPKCVCGDPAGTDAAGKPLMHQGRPRCSECWAELHTS